MKKAFASFLTLFLFAAFGAAETSFFGEDVNDTFTLPDNPSRLVEHPESDGARAKLIVHLDGVAEESFEGFADGQAVTSLLFGSVTARLFGPATVIRVPRDTVDGVYPISGDKCLYVESSPDYYIEFSEPQVVFGFYATDVGDQTGHLVVETCRSGAVTGNHRLFHSVNAPSNSGSVLYFGIVDLAQPFDKIVFRNTVGASDAFGLDNFLIAGATQVYADQLTVEEGLLVSFVTRPSILYQLQKSRNMRTWYNVGEPFIGDGGMHEAFVNTRARCWNFRLECADGPQPTTTTTTSSTTTSTTTSSTTTTPTSTTSSTTLPPEEYVIDFDDYPMGLLSFASSNRYQTVGAMFGRDIPIYSVALVEDASWVSTFIAAGGTLPNVMGMSWRLDPRHEIDMRFVVPGTSTPATVDHWRALFLDSNLGTTLVKVDAFDAAGALITTLSPTTGVSRAEVIEINRPGIARVRISDVDDGMETDNIYFTVPVAISPPTTTTTTISTTSSSSTSTTTTATTTTTTTLAGPGSTIDFDDYPMGLLSFASSNRYQSVGAVFGRDIPVYSVAMMEGAWWVSIFVAGGGTLPNVMPLSPRVDARRTIDIRFVVPGTSTPATVDHWRALFLDSNLGTTLVKVDAFDAAGALITTLSPATGVSRAQVIEINRPGIARVRINDVDDGMEMDNIYFTTPVAQ